MEVTGRLLAVAAVSVCCLQPVAAQDGGDGGTPAARPSSTPAPQAKQAPRFTVDYKWPAPLPVHHLLGSAVGVAVDAQDHVFVVHKVDSFTGRTETGGDADPPIGECCFSAPPVLEFDASGKLVNSWGGPGSGYAWPEVPAGVAIDPKGNVWITGAGGLDGQVLVFTHDGKFVRQIGKEGAAPGGRGRGRGAADTAYQGVSPGGRGGAARGARGGRGGRGRGGPPPMLPPNSMSTEMFGGAARIAFSTDGATAFIADGERNHRVVAVDAATGAIRKFWGAYGKEPSDAAGAGDQQFNGVACVEASKDGMLYVCDRGNDRIQVFKQDGSYVKEMKVAPNTRGEGSVWDIALSADAGQRYLYVADGMNDKVRILDRATLTELTNFGEGGRVPGEFYAVHSIATDSKGNIYTTETYEGKRVQKFIFSGVGAVTKAEQGVLWPGAGR